MQNDSLRTLFLYCSVVRMSHKNTKHFSTGGNFIVSARQRNKQQTKRAAKDKPRDSSSSKDNFSKCSKGNGVLGNIFPSYFSLYVEVKKLFVLHHIFFETTQILLTLKCS